MQLFSHCLYELQKGVRSLALLTLEAQKANEMVERLQKNNVHFYIQKIKDEKVNLYFGEQSCIDVIKSFCNKDLNKLSAEEDFMLGIMLGYDKNNQCKRYLNKKGLI